MGRLICGYIFEPMLQTPRNRASTRGFTLFELMITIAVAGVLAAVAVPNMRDFVRNNRLASAANDLLRASQVARSEAIKRQRVVAVCASANPDSDDAECSNGSFTGWIVFEDVNNTWQREAGEEVLEREQVGAGVTVVNDNDGIVSFTATGFANSTPGHAATTRVVACDVRGNVQVGANSVARALVIENTGRTRVTRDYGQISAALGAVGGTCP